MSVATKTEILSTLASAGQGLQSMATMVDREIGSVAKTFGILAGHADGVLRLAAEMMACVENENVSTVLPKVQSLGSAARHFINSRLEATGGILEVASAEVKLLRQLSRVANGQQAIAMEIKALSVLTNIEVARLGQVGMGFQYLAQELSAFSKSVVEDTQELSTHTEGRRAAIEETRRILSAEIPRLRQELTRIESDLKDALEVVAAALSQLATTPARFRECVEEIAGQITAVVAAIQSHDISRQMNEHVVKSLALIADRLSGTGDTASEIAEELPRTYVGLRIQIGQLQTIEETVNAWTSQTKDCMKNILRVSAAELSTMGRAVAEQERKVSAQLACIELLEEQSQSYSEKTRHSLQGLTNLMQLVREHVQRQQSVRDRLRMLAFNSIIEANHLGTKADAILAISKSIKGISATWSEITDQSEQALQEILALVQQSNGVTEAFSKSSADTLQEAQAQTRTGLDGLREAANFTAIRAREMTLATEKMQATIKEVGATEDVLEKAFAQSAAALREIESLRLHLEVYYPWVRQEVNPQEAEHLFSVFYTTELERDVLRAALRQTDLPTRQPIVAGNSVELF
jgi:hypothetical protein